MGLGAGRLTDAAACGYDAPAPMRPMLCLVVQGFSTVRSTHGVSGGDWFVEFEVPADMKPSGHVRFARSLHTLPARPETATSVVTQWCYWEHDGHKHSVAALVPVGHQLQQGNRWG